MHSAGSLIGQAHDHAATTHSLNGDLRQMSSQANFLQQRGINVGVNGGIPGVFSAEDYEKAMRLIWEHKYEGWWNYQHDLLRLGICTADEFKVGFNN